MSWRGDRIVETRVDQASSLCLVALGRKQDAGDEAAFCDCVLRATLGWTLGVWLGPLSVVPQLLCCQYSQSRTGRDKVT